MWLNVYLNILKNKLILNIPSCPAASNIPSIDSNSFPTSAITKIDSGATRNYLTNRHAKILQNVYILTNGPIAHLPDNTTIQANKAGIIPLHTSLA